MRILSWVIILPKGFVTRDLLYIVLFKAGTDFRQTYAC